MVYKEQIKYRKTRLHCLQVKLKLINAGCVDPAVIQYPHDAKKMSLLSRKRPSSIIKSIL